MRINDRLDADMEQNDAKFVRAASDDINRRERLQQLTKTRRTFCKIAIVQMLLFLTLFLSDFFLYFVSKEKSGQMNQATALMGGAAIFYLMFFFYIDIQIKFLKVTSTD